jgi:hypothetical protein
MAEGERLPRRALPPYLSPFVSPHTSRAHPLLLPHWTPSPSPVTQPRHPAPSTIPVNVLGVLVLGPRRSDVDERQPHRRPLRPRHTYSRPIERIESCQVQVLFPFSSFCRTPQRAFYLFSSRRRTGKWVKFYGKVTRSDRGKGMGRDWQLNERTSPDPSISCRRASRPPPTPNSPPITPNHPPPTRLSVYAAPAAAPRRQTRGMRGWGGGDENSLFRLTSARFVFTIRLCCSTRSWTALFDPTASLGIRAQHMFVTRL